MIIGIDEAGRGCLAGRVYAGAVVLTSGKDLSGIRDSKQISETRRESLFEQILNEHRCGIGFADVKEITEINILNAAFLAMKRAFENLKLTNIELKSAHILVDGNMAIRGLSDVKQTPIVKGDQKEKAIAAASILAKVSRDRELRKWHEIYPQYGFNEHKGYATEVHRKAIAKFGPCDIHRTTFAGVKEFVHIRKATRSEESVPL
jgi:ribonuclease HII